MNASDIINEVQYELADPDGDEFTEESLLQPLNNALRWVSSKSRSITHEISFPVIEGQYVYGMQDGLLSIAGAQVQNQGRGSNYPPFIPLTRAKLTETDLIGVNYVDTPQYYCQWGRAQIYRTLTTPVTAVEAVGNIIVFERGDIRMLFVGDQILNLSDDLAVANIQTIESYDDPEFYRVSHTGFEAGMDNRVEVGDRLRILAPAWTNHSVLIAPAPDWTDEMGEESLRILASFRHYEVTQAQIDNGTDNLEIDDELLESVKYRLCFYAASSEGGVGNGKDYLLLAGTEFADNIDLVRKRTSDAISLWEKKYPLVTRPYTTGGGARPNNDFV